MVRTGEITEVREGMIRISFCRQEACEKCGACDGNKKKADLWISGDGKVGDIAVVELPESAVIHASAVAYGLPLVLFISGLIAGGMLLPGKEYGVAGGGLIGLILAAAMIAFTENKRKAQGRITPKLISVSEANFYGNHSDI